MLAMYKKGGGKAGRHADIARETNISAISNIVVQLYEYAYGQSFRPNPERLAVLGAVQFMLIPSNNFLCILGSAPRETSSLRVELSNSDFVKFTSALDNRTNVKDLASLSVIDTVQNLNKRKKKDALEEEDVIMGA